MLTRIQAPSVRALRCSLEVNFPATRFSIEQLDSGSLIIRFRGPASYDSVCHAVYTRTDADFHCVKITSA